MTRTSLEDSEHLWNRDQDPGLFEAALHLPRIHYPGLPVAATLAK